MKKGPRAPIAQKKLAQPIPAARVVNIKLQWPPKEIAEQNKLGDQLVEWAVVHDGNKIEDFPLQRFINPFRFKHIGDDNEYFRECYEYAQYMIGARLQNGIHAKSDKIDRELGMRLLPMYNREYAETLLKMRTPPQLNQNSGIQYIVMEKMPSSPLVPERITDEKE